MTIERDLIRRALIWTLAITSAACAIAWPITLRTQVIYVNGATLCSLGFGRVMLQRRPPRSMDFPDGFNVEPIHEVLRRTIWSPVYKSGSILDGPEDRGFWFTIQIPLWTFVVVFALNPTLAFICGPLRRWRRRRASACLRCGYDLTGNVTGICPECGSKLGSAA